ncbi:hypothetical protein [Absidia glauca]|uniref:Uncharacterized protein n=1 Tax=Absidia glauca TaxID=4829 RepID=A0A163JEZ4_ABSGL|nr:hypothetical protein [Absidia glauca]
MDPLPTYSAIVSPPTYEASSQQGAIWPRDCGRQRVDVAKFYHDFVLTFPYQEHDEQKEELSPPPPPESPRAASESFLDPAHHATMPELNRMLMQTWPKTEAVPSYEAFKAKVSHCDLRPIPNNSFQTPPK